MISKTITLAALLGLAAPALATDLDLAVESGGQDLVHVLPGATVEYTVTGVLTDSGSQGLAMFAFDLSFSGGPLRQADAPTSGPMTNFASPLGLNNPAGFGGTPIGGDLIQVGGAQNTIKNSFAPKPSGTVMTGVGQPGSPVVLVSGSLTAPTTAGTYQLSVDDLFANVIRAGETGIPFWAVDAAEAGTLSSLTIDVDDCGPVSYCTAKVNSQGCLPSIGWSGSPTLGGADDFHLTASNVINNKFGLMFWNDAQAAVPFMNGLRCVANPVIRTPNQSSGGNAPPDDCSGSYDFHFSHAYMASKGLQVGDAVYAQYWFRDPAQPDGTGVGLTDAAAFLICP
jgi:hypothetical protein